MKRSLYTLGVRAYALAIRLASPWRSKARAWVQGRRNWRLQWASLRQSEAERWVWFHCASLGEFEQGRNLIDAIEAQHPELRLLVTFFSPSGYQIRHHYPRADAVHYLPVDTPAAASYLVAQLRPELVFWIKYELWVNVLQELQRQQVPVLLVAARMDADSAFLQGPLAPLYAEVLRGMRHVFTQDEATRQRLLPLLGEERVTVSADTRFDRVLANRETWTPRPEVEAFLAGRTCLMGGSVWPPGEELLHQAFRRLREQHDLCLILAPHDIHPERIARWEARFPGECLRYSQLEQLEANHRILWIDNVGMLAQLYHYADVAYVGGGWGSGLHNILEPAAFGCPVVFGPKHQKFAEAADLIAAGGAQSIANQAELDTCLQGWLSNPGERARVGQCSRNFVEERAGATKLILQWCYQQRLLPPSGSA